MIGGTILDVWGKPMSPDEQAAKSVRYTYGALVVPLDSGNYGVFTKFHEFRRVCTLEELPTAIREAADHGFNMKKQVEYETRYAKNFKRTPGVNLPGVPSASVSPSEAPTEAVGDPTLLGL